MRDDGDTLETAVTVDRETAGEEPTVGVRRRGVARLGQGDRYLLGDEIGRGGMGEVVAATDEMIGREVAIKRMLRANASDRAMARFFREATIQGRLDHPAIVPVHEIGVDPDGRPYFVMKKLAGVSMGQLIDRNAARTRLLRAFADVCLAVELAHTRGVVHRDLKPENILLGEFGEVYVIDWGVAKIASDPEDDKPEFTRVELSELHTALGTAIGTPGYMSPEQIAGSRDLDGRADVYALGCVLFEILTGKMMQPKGEPPHERPSKLGADIPPELDALCVHATAPDRDARVRTARELSERVQRYLDGDRDLALRRQLASEHYVNAQEAFARIELEPEARATAMREAARALALDPKLAGAAELLTRLMLEPPRVPPPEVERELANDKLAEIHRHSGTGLRGYVGYLALVPLLAFTELRFYAVALVVVVGLNMALLRKRATIATLDMRAVTLAIANALLIALLGRMFSPVLCAPAIATATATALVFGPSYDGRLRMLSLSALLIAAVLLPWLLEATGTLAHTLVLTPQGMEVVAPALRIGDTWTVGALALATFATILSAAGMAQRMSASDRAVRRRLHLQAWQLRQLVPVPS